MAMVSGPAAALPSPAVESPFTTLSTNTRNVTLMASDTFDGTSTAFVWTEVNDTGVSRILARFYNTAGGWADPYQLKHPAGRVYTLEVAMGGTDGTMTAHTLWTDANDGALWYASLNERAFSGPYLIRNQTVNAQITPALVAIGSSRAMAVWVEGSGPGATTWAATVGPGGALTTPAALDDGALSTTAVAVVATPSGRSTALWCAQEGANASLMVAEAALASDFSAPRVGLSGFGSSCDRLSAAQDFYGNIWSAFQYLDASLGSHVGWSFAPAGAPFGALVDLGQATEGVWSLALRANLAGYGVLVWSEVFSGPSTYYYSTYASAFDIYTGLHDNVTLSNRAIDLPPLIGVEMMASGGALVFMAGTDQSYEYKTFQYTRDVACSGWSQEQDAGIASFYPVFVDLSLDGTGRGSVAYSQFDAGHSVLVVAPIAALAAPTFYVDFPADGQLLEYPLAVITGTAPGGAYISDGSVTAVAQSSGTFVIVVPVVHGSNLIVLNASFADPWAGCTLSDSLFVSYDDPLVPILADLTAAQARVDALNTTLNSTRGDLADAQAALNASAAELAALSLELNDTTAQLNEVKVKFPWLEANATAAQANATIFKGELAALQADYDAAQARIQLLEARENSTNSVVQNATSQNAALAGQVAVLSIVAFASLIAGVGAMAVTLIQSKRGGGGGGGGGGGSRLLAHEAAHTVQQGQGKVEVRGWDPKKKESIEGGAESPGSSAKEFSPAEEQLKGNPRH